MKKQSSKVKIAFDGYWYWILSSETYDYEIKGKYLFFSRDQERLVEVATREILHHQFHKAKINSKLLANRDEHVLCLYYKDDSRKYELANRCQKDYPDVNYRYWKSDEATLRGEYSQKFLSGLDTETRLEFTAPKRIIEFEDSKGKTILRQAIVNDQSKKKTKRSQK